MPRDELPKETLNDLITEAFESNDESWDDVLEWTLIDDDKLVKSAEQRETLLNRPHSYGTIGYKQIGCTLWTGTYVYFLLNARGYGIICHVPREPNPKVCVKLVE